MSEFNKSLKFVIENKYLLENKLALAIENVIVEFEKEHEVTPSDICVNMTCVGTVGIIDRFIIDSVEVRFQYE